MTIATATLEEAGVRVLDCEHKTPAARQDGHPYIAIPQIQDGRVILDGARLISSDDLAEWTRRTTPRGGDVLVTRRGRVGDTAPIPEGLDCAIGQNLVLLRSDGRHVDQAFLRWAVRGPSWWGEVNRLMNVGAVFSSLNVRDISLIELPFPDLATQRGIAATLGALDRKIESNRRLARLALDTAQALYESECENAAEVVPLADAGRWLSGGTPTTSNSEYWGGDLPWISAASLKSFYLESSDRTLTMAGAEQATNIVRAGTVLFVVRGMSLKSEFRLGVAQRSVAFGQDCKAIEPSIPSAILALALRASRREILDLVDEAGHGTGRLATDLLEQFAISLPTEPKVAAALDDLVARGASASREARQLGELRDALLPELLSGRMRVTDATNSPGARA